jgi:hypothetical protein
MSGSSASGNFWESAALLTSAAFKCSSVKPASSSSDAEAMLSGTKIITTQNIDEKEVWS